MKIKTYLLLLALVSGIFMVPVHSYAQAIIPPSDRCMKIQEDYQALYAAYQALLARRAYLEGRYKLYAEVLMARTAELQSLLAIRGPRGSNPSIEREIMHLLQIIAELKMYMAEVLEEVRQIDAELVKIANELAKMRNEYEGCITDWWQKNRNRML